MRVTSPTTVFHVPKQKSGLQLEVRCVCGRVHRPPRPAPAAREAPGCFAAPSRMDTATPQGMVGEVVERADLYDGKQLSANLPLKVHAGPRAAQ